VKTNLLSDAEALGVEITGDQEFCSYPDYDCSVWCISEEQLAIPDNSISSHSAISDNVVTRIFELPKLMRKF